MQTSKGFSLIELLVILAIAGIVGVIGLPIYKRYEFRITHTDAVAGVMMAHNTLEKCASAAGGIYDGCDAGFPILSPKNSYSISVVLGAPPATTYTITATRARPDPGETCGNYTLNELGQRGITFGNVQDCWIQ
ncbi:MAG: prepilin-type N-terminal cleavage/methylation domain-containing protein [Gammaproteobacteria bacterium]|nr:prepilin-type N-terminal cleavage/methylation domain-containing protein [Gammaproteobacteria bacterium]MDH5651160.1 prepilin-type N-terminal cleavage/methylation domain-containing protein [Gammaproteobacteria bacterium]